MEGIEEPEPHPRIGDKLDFFREPENSYGDRLCVPQEDNIVFRASWMRGNCSSGGCTPRRCAASD
ncbi:MAG: hypothetical protein ACOYI8_08585 [Christensenellales bacterium]